MSKKSTILILFFSFTTIIMVTSVTSCKKIFPEMVNPEYGLCGPVSLSGRQTMLFSARNDQFFATRTAATGLGPYFVAISCGSCPASDNRGHQFTLPARLGQNDSSCWYMIWAPALMMVIPKAMPKHPGGAQPLFGDLALCRAYRAAAFI